MKKITILLLFSILLSSCKNEPKKDDSISLKEEVQTFLDDYSKEFVKLRTASAEASWAANTKIVEGDTLNAYNVQITGEAIAKFTGSTDVIEKTRKYLEQKELLDTVQVRQLNAIFDDESAHQAAIRWLSALRC